MDSLIGTGSCDPNDSIESRYAKNAYKTKKGLATLEILTKKERKNANIEFRNACLEDLATELITLRT